MESNIEKSINSVKEAASQGADLVLFPEVQLTEFFPQYPGQDVRKYQISLDSNIIRRFCDTCRENLSWLSRISIFWKMESHTTQAF